MSVAVSELHLDRTADDVYALPHARSRNGGQQFGQAWVAALLAGDITMLLIAANAAAILVGAFWDKAISGPHVVLSTIAFTVLSLAIFAQLGLYRRSFAFTLRDEFYQIVAAMSLAAIPQLVLFTLVPSVSTSRITLIASLALGIAAVGSHRAALYAIRESLAMAKPRRIAVVGRPDRIETAEDAMREIPYSRVYRLSVSTLDNLPASRAEIEAAPWFETAMRWNVDTLVFTEILSPDVMPQLLAAAAARNVRVAFAPPRVRAHAYDLAIETVGKQALIVARPLRATAPDAKLIKRAFDLTVASIATLIFAPVMAVVALVIALERSGPIFYRQVRVGRNGKTFSILKFRTMRTDAERDGARLAVAGDPRVTKVGRFLRRTSLDELPQLFNVLRGEMSVVGPRPERPEFVETFARNHPRYHERHLVRPGITGWAQVHLKRVLAADDVAEKLEHDLFYVENWSFFVDVAVVCKTAFEVLFHRAA